MSLLTPTSIAVIGASSQPGKVGHDILKNLLSQEYGGTVFAVNVKGGEILGKQAFVSVKDIPDAIDLAVIVIPAAVVPQALTECGEKKIKNVIVISAGFGEVHTDEGKKLEEEIVAIAKKYNINLVGPNCLGVVRPCIKMNASFAKDMPPAGSIALISQSGATAVALMDMAPQLGLGFSLVASIGNKAVMDECDFLEICEKDDDTKVIAFYLESIKDGRRLREVATRVAAKKPIVLLKAGVSEHGSKAAASHTGALAGNDAGIDALCAATGIHRAHTSEELCDLLSVLSAEPPLQTNRIAIITNAGGPGILATDAAAEIVGGRRALPLRLPELSADIALDLRTKLPPAASVKNPIDVIGDAGADRYEAALTACKNDPNIDGVVVLLTPQVMTPVVEVAETIIRVMKNAKLMPVTVCFMGGETVNDGVELLRKNGIPCFPTPERAVNAMAALQINTTHDSPVRTGTGGRPTTHATSDHSKKAADLIGSHSGLLNEDTTAQLFALYDLPMPAQALAHTADEAVTIAKKIGYPVIAKISSPDIVHKTDVGGLRANLRTDDEVRNAFTGIMADVAKNMPSASLKGVLIQQFLPAGAEFIVGSIRDASFGPLIMTGLGGIYTELFNDTTFRIAPVTQETAYDMLQDLKAWKLLLGMRGKPQSDIDALASLVEKVSRMVTDVPQIKELDLNPVLVSHATVIIADAKVVLG